MLNIIRDVIIQDITNNDLTCFFVISANSYQTIYKEDALDPVTGKHHYFTNLDEFKQFIDNQYADEEED